MKKILIITALCLPVMLAAQNSITSNVVEGGKTLVELIKVIRSPKLPATPAAFSSIDSCGSKKLADISFKNRMDKNVQVSLFLRLGNIYDSQALSLKLSAASQESLYDLRAGVYKYKIETEEGGKKIVLHEGEIKLQPCDKLIKEIKG